MIRDRSLRPGHEPSETGLYLASHDLLSDPRPRKVNDLYEAVGVRAGASYFVARVDPHVVTRFRDGPLKRFDLLILTLVNGRTLADVGKVDVGVDIVICPEYAGGQVDEEVCSRIGMGSLHATYEDALEDSPVD